MTKYHVTNLLSKDEITACFNVHLSGYKKEKVVHYMYTAWAKKLTIEMAYHFQSAFLLFLRMKMNLFFLRWPM